MNERDITKCAHHPDRPAVATCVTCGEPVCAECARLVDGKYYCERHVPVAEVRTVPAPRGGRLRPGLLLLLAAAVGAAWGALALLRPAMEWSAEFYQDELTRARLEEVAAAADYFKKDTGRYPTADEGLIALVEEPPGEGGWLGPYLPESYVVDGAVTDAAGEPLTYEVSADEHVVKAAGTDGERGTADDVELRFEGRSEGKNQPAFPSLWGNIKKGGAHGLF